MEDEKVTTHPSYGLVGFSRASVCGMKNRRMFGSAIGKHFNIVLLEIRRAEQHHHLSRDWFHGREELIRVELSEAQFASLLTNMNSGDGVPCTITYVKGEGRIDPPPDEPVEAERVRRGFEEKFQKFRDEFAGMAKRAHEILGKAGAKKAERDEMIRMFERAAGYMENNAGFVVEQFAEATEKVVTHAKAEVDAFVANAARVTGMERLKEMGLAKEELALPAPEEMVRCVGCGVEISETEANVRNCLCAECDEDAQKEE